MFLTLNRDRLSELRFKLLMELQISENILENHSASNVEIQRLKSELIFNVWFDVINYKKKDFKIIE
jgi:hypothetical protein